MSTVPADRLAKGLYVGAVVAGRIATWHCTEMEALVAGWKYWVVSALAALPVLIYDRR